MRIYIRLNVGGRKNFMYVLYVVFIALLLYLFFIHICCVTWKKDQFYRCFYLSGKFASNMRFCLKLKIANYRRKIKELCIESLIFT